MAQGRLPSGALYIGNSVVRKGVAAFRDALTALARPVYVVEVAGSPAVTDSGRAVLGAAGGNDGSLPLLAHAPALLPENLGNEAFRAAHRVRYALVSGEMANGIASEEMVEAMAEAGLLGFFGAAGLSPARVEKALVRFTQGIGARGLAYGCNLIHSPDDPALEAAVVSLYLKHGMRLASASAYLDLTLPIVRYRVTGIHEDANGRVVTPNKVMAKVSRVEVARKFLAPPPEAFLAQLVASKEITPEQAKLASRIPMADDVTAEADSGGHTDNRPLVLLLPAIQALRDEIAAREQYVEAPRVGAAGGIATPASVAAAFAMGAAYVMTGSVNQCTREAGTSDLVRQMLAEAASTDVAMAPAADMFEMGVKVQVLSRGTMFAVRAAKLYELYRQHDSLDALPAAAKTELEQKYLRTTIAQAWESTRAFFANRDPRQNERAERDPKHKMALVFRSYLGQSSRWANAGVADRRLDYQVWCGPAMGAFNAWVAGSFLAPWENRRVVAISENLMAGAAVLTRLSALRTQGVELPQELERFEPRDERGLAAMRVPPVEEREMTVPSVLSSGAERAGGERSDRERAGRPKADQARNNDEPIAIVGMGSLFPKAENLAAFWRLLRTGIDAVGEVPESHWSIADYYDADPKAPDKTYTKRGAFLSPYAFDPTEFGIPPSILEATDTAQLLALAVARMAMDDAGYGDGVSWDRGRASVLLGVTGTQELVISLGARLGHPHWRRALKDAGVDETTANDVVERISRAYVGWQENSFPGLLGNVVAGRVANRLDFGGTNCVTDAACASSLAAVHLAMMELRANRSDLVLTGGVDALNDIFMHMCFSKTPALSPTGDSRPFSADADGTLLGEGLGMLVLKRLSDAERAGDRIHAVIKSIGTSSDGRAKSIYAPLSAGQARALREAYELADAPPSTIDLVEAHGTGTKAGDVAEFDALREVYRSSKPEGQWAALGSVKSQIGHTKAAAGAAGLIKAALALEHKVLPPTLKITAPHPSLKIAESPFYLSGVARPWVSKKEHPRRAAVSSFGFGGSNFHAVLEEYRPERVTPAWDGAIEIVALSANDANGLAAGLDALAKITPATLADHAAETRAKFRTSDAHRLVLVVPHGADLAALCANAKTKLAAGKPYSGAKDGIHYGTGTPAGSLAFLFPGQGAQYVGMGRELACVFPEMLDALEAFPGTASTIHPAPSFDPEENKRREAALTRTDAAQPAIGAVSHGLANVLARFGVKPALTAGHSYGELVALQTAGWFDAASLAKISALRGSLMAGNGEDRGTMLAVLAPLADVEKLLSEEKLDLVLANRNAPSQGVLSGSRDEIARAEAACAKRGLRTAKLNVAAAFHSRFVSGAAQSFRAGLEQIPFTPASVPVIADATASPYPANAAEARDLLARQLAEPVRFVDVVERLYTSGARTFLEVGPKSVLTGLAKSILGDREATCLAIDASAGNGLADLAGVLARLAALGHTVRLDEWQRVPAPPRAAQRTPRVAKMSVPLTGANYRNPVAPLAPSPARAPVAASPAVAASNPVPRPAAIAPVANAPVSAPRPPAAPTAPRPVSAAPVAPGILMNKPSVPGASNDAILEILRSNQESVRALQQMQEQTARIHQAFLEGQLQAQQSFHALLTGTQQLAGLAASAPLAIAASPVAVAAVPAAAPAPVVAPVAPAPVAVVAPAPIAARAAVPVDAKAPVVARPVAAATVAAAPAIDDVTPALLAVVAEATGYPREMLELDMDMEADLGIDSIKRVEILSLLSKKVAGAPSVNPEHLGKLRTLRQVAAFMRPEGVAAPAPIATPVAASPVAASTPAAASGPSNAEAHAALITVVAELTGYPKEMLALDMEMEADLGIDSIKRVEILSLLSKRMPGAPSVNPEKLGSLRTLRQVLDFIAPAGGSAVSAAAPAAAPVAAAPVSAGASNADAHAALISVVAELTGYPKEMLALDMEMEADLGIDSIKRVEILSLLSKRMPGAPSVNPEKLGALRTLRQVLDFISPSSGPAANAIASAPPTATVSTPAVAAAPSEIRPRRRAVVPVSLKNGESIALPAGEILVLEDGTSFGAAVAKELTSRGLSARTVAQPFVAPTGPIAGLVLLAGSSRADDNGIPGDERRLKAAFTAAQAFGPALRKTAGARLFSVSRLDGAFGHVLGAPAGVELQLGLAGLVKTASHEWPEVRCRAIDVSPLFGEAEAAAAVAAELTADGPIEVGVGPAGRTALALRETAMTYAPERIAAGDVVVVTGGARGVTAECAVALAKARPVSLLLLGRTPAPAAEPAWLQGASDEAAIKRALLENGFSGAKPSPRELGDACRAVLAAREIRGTLERLSAIGAKALYRAVDVRDTTALASVLDEARKALGPLKGLVHGAGVLRDRRIEDKSPEDLDQVFDTKVAGLRSLLAATASDDLRFIALFASISGRLGRRGQSDYAMANQALVGIAQVEAARRPGCRVAALDWGPWDGGMVTPALKREFEREKVELVPLAAGAQILVEEVHSAPGGPIEVVIGNGFGLPVSADDGWTVASTQRLDVETHVYLRDHVLAGNPVLPMAMILEWFAQSARRAVPGSFLTGIEDVKLLKGVVLASGVEDVSVWTGPVEASQSGARVALELRGRNGFVHARATAVLGAAATTAAATVSAGTLRPYPHDLAKVYGEKLFHGRLFKTVTGIRGFSENGMDVRLASAPAPSEWIRGAKGAWSTDPLVLDGVFQTLILWCRETQGAPSLPSRLGALRLFRDRFPADGITAVVGVREVQGSSVVSHVDLLDASGAPVARLEDYVCTVSASLDKAFAESAVAPRNGNGAAPRA